MPTFQESDFPFPFADPQRQEAAALVKDGKVQILEGHHEGFFEAKVAFFRRFQTVWIEKKDGRAAAECTCPFLENEKRGCAHVLALMLAVNAQAEEQAAEAVNARSLVPIYGVRARKPGLDFSIGLFEKDDAGRLSPLVADARTLDRITGADDAAILRGLELAAGGRRSLLEDGGFRDPAGPWPLSPELRARLLPLLAKTGRLVLVLHDTAKPDRGIPLVLDPGPPFDLIAVFESEAGSPPRWQIRGILAREGEIIAANEAGFLVADAAPLVIHRGRIIAVTTHGAPDWLPLLARKKPFALPEGEPSALLARLAAAGPMPRVQTAGSRSPLPLVEEAPQPAVRFQRAGAGLAALLGFRYGGRTLAAEDGRHLVLDVGMQRQLRRDLDRERALEDGFAARHGVERDHGTLGRFFVEPAFADGLAVELAREGWHVEIDDRPVRKSSAPSLRLRSGVDWFELEGTIRFEGAASVELGAALAAWRDGRSTVVLPDGSLGVLPEEFLDRLSRFAADADTDGERVCGKLRLTRAQALLAEAWSGAVVEAHDDRFLRARDALPLLVAPTRRAPPAGFRGSLRPYQEEGLGWLSVLVEHGLGGCLADDMGLGKTVQALALILGLAEQGKSTLVVAPRSLLVNWQEEARRFAPSLDVLVHYGPSRSCDAAGLGKPRFVLTTYGTLRRDQEILAGIPFDLVILDEAQAIKNKDSQNAVAARALSAAARVSLTGTPIENSLRDLWSQLEFLNPGLLGAERRFMDNFQGPDAAPARARLATALRPFLLRRTKEKVAPELPPKTEQTMLAPLTAAQEMLYATVRDAARQALEQDLGALGIEGTRFHVLEALLRLRQIACHPGLVDAAQSTGASGKLDLLLDELEQVVHGVHKALVFSQFVGFLKIVASRLDALKFPYAWLDGQTRDRAAPVHRFQEDPDCPLFLISLKAGGVGLNLTAADYVFLLDPWWNPAVEAQAIDRAHRIGQTKPVFAYRLVAQGTVEERILDLQAGKKGLADAILAGDTGPLKSLTADDLRALLA